MKRFEKGQVVWVSFFDDDGKLIDITGYIFITEVTTFHNTFCIVMPRIQGQSFEGMLIDQVNESEEDGIVELLIFAKDSCYNSYEEALSDCSSFEEE